MLPLFLLVAAFAPMALEARVAARHDRALRASGAVEPAGDVYWLMRVAYPACFLGMAAEGWIRGARLDSTWLAGLVLFALAKSLKYWAISALGPRWTFRVLVPPRSVRVTHGPYRFMRHPNYAAVAGELAGFALMSRAPVAGAASIAAFSILMLARIRVEERAMRAPLG
jgi:methyltransferase